MSGGIMRRDVRSGAIGYGGRTVTAAQRGRYCGACGEAVLADGGAPARAEARGRPAQEHR